MSSAVDSPANTQARLKEGAVCQLTGAADFIDGPQHSPLSKTPCVYWQILEGIDAVPSGSAEIAKFWLDTEQGRILIDVTNAELDIRVQRRRQIVALADSDIQSVSEKLRAIKAQRKTVHGDARKRLNGQYNLLKKTATLLCAIRSQARGNVHVGGTLEGQQRYIEERGPILRAQGAKADILGLTEERFEALIRKGQRLRVTGFCKRVHAPHGSGAQTGYRDAPTCLALCSTAEQPLQVSGLGALAPIVDKKRRRAARQAEHKAQQPSGLRHLWWLWLTFVATVIYLMLR